MSTFPRAMLSALLLVSTPTGAAAIERTEVWRSGDPAVGLEGSPPLVSFSPVGWTADGALLFLGRTDAPDCSARSGIWRWTAEAGLGLLIATEPESLGGIQHAGTSRAGYALVQTSKTDSPCMPIFGTSRQQLHVVDPSGEVLATIAERDPILLGDASLWIVWIESWDPWDRKWSHVVTNSGRAFARVTLATDPDADVDSGLWRDALLFFDESGAPQILAMQGDPAPDLPDSCRFDRVELARVDAAADVAAFTASVLCGADRTAVLYRWSRADGAALVDVEPSETFDDWAIFAKGAVFANGAILYGIRDQNWDITAWYVANPGAEPMRVLGLGDAIPGLEGDERVVSLDPYYGPYVAASVSGAAFSVRLESSSNPDDFDNGVLLERDETGSLEVRLRSGAAVPWETAASFCPRATPYVYGYDEGRILFAMGIQREGDPKCSDFGFYALEPDGTGRLAFLRDDFVDMYRDFHEPAFSPDFSRAAYCEGDEGPKVCWVLTAPEPHGPIGALAAVVGLVAARLRPTRSSIADRLRRIHGV